MSGFKDICFLVTVPRNVVHCPSVYKSREKNGLWELHLESVAEIIFYLFSFDRTNYSRWAPVYIADMYRRQETAPDVHQEFMNGNHPVKRSKNTFNQVWSDMALEQSVNPDSKTEGEKVGITLQKNALDRWFLTAHVRAAVTSAIKEICSISDDDEQVLELSHNEIVKKRRCRDERDVQSMLTTVVKQMVNPFEGRDVKELQNITTGVIAPAEVAQGILEAKKMDRKL